MHALVRSALVVLVACGGGASSAPKPVVEQAAVVLQTSPVDAGVDGSTTAVQPPTAARRVVFGDDPRAPVLAPARALATPVGARGIVQLVGTMGRMCALRASGEVSCSKDGGAWTAVKGITDAAHLSISNDLACDVRKNGAVACWGYVNEAWGFHEAPTDIPHVSGARRVTNEDATACAMLGNGHVQCVGMGPDMLGRPLERTREPVEPLDLADVVDVFGGRFEACARVATGAIECWGVAEHQTLGSVEGTPNGPIELVGLRGATDIAFEQQWACATLADGGVACWGDGNVAKNDDEPPAPFSFQHVCGFHDGIALALGIGHACVLQRSGHVTCFGSNHESQLGDGTKKSRFGGTDDTLIPVSPADVASGRGGGYHNPPLKRPPGPRSERLVHVVGVSDAVQIANDGFATCALRRTGTIVCWGKHLPGTKIDEVNVATPIPGP